MNLQSITSARSLAAQTALSARPNRSSPGTPSRESSPLDRLPEPVRSRIEEKQARMADRLGKAMHDARGPRGRELLEARMGDAERAMNARIDAMIASRSGPGPAQPADDPLADGNPGTSPGVNQGPAATQAERRTALMSRIAASATTTTLPDSVMSRIAAQEGAGAVTGSDPAGTTGRSFLDAFSEAVDLLRDRGNAALSGAENANQRRIIEDRVTEAIGDMASRLRDALAEGRSASENTDAGRSGAALFDAADAARTALAARVQAALSGAETTSQLRILGDRADAAAHVMEERIESAMLGAGLDYDGYEHEFSGPDESRGALHELPLRFGPIPPSTGARGLLAETAFRLRA